MHSTKKLLRQDIKTKFKSNKCSIKVTIHCLKNLIFVYLKNPRLAHNPGMEYYSKSVQNKVYFTYSSRVVVLKFFSKKSSIIKFLPSWRQTSLNFGDF